MAKKAVGLSLISCLFVLVFVGVMFIPSNDAVIKANKKSVQIGKLDFGKGKNDFVSAKDGSLSPGKYEYKSVTISHKLYSPKSDHTKPLIITAQKGITIKKQGAVDYSGSGYISSVQNHDSSSNDIVSGNGGNGGGYGGTGTCLKGTNQGEQLGQIDINPFYGQAGYGVKSEINSSGGWGGGYVLLESPEIIVDGSLSVNGNNGTNKGGGGGGGKIVLLTNKLVINGSVVAKGGNGGTSFIQGAGGGGGGIIILSLKNTGSGKIDVSGGMGGKALDIYTGCDGQPGNMGIIAMP